ncbi:hypothetical protein V8F20_004862 [Naviculisporaceae sp. PSN 640]
MSGSGARLVARLAQSITGKQVAGAGAGRAGAKKPQEPINWKAGALSVLFFGVIVTGTLYGASLKTQSQVEAEKQKIEQATAEENLLILQNRRNNLERLRLELEQKLNESQARRGEGKFTPEQLAQQEADKPKARPLNFLRGSQ